MKAITAITLVLSLALLIVSCDNQPPFSADEAIKLAKAAAHQIPSPPSIYYSNSTHIGDGGNIGTWPDQPIAKNSIYYSCPDVCRHPITFTTAVNLSSGGYDVTFKSDWQPSSGVTKAHSWLFHVDADRNATFVREEGDTLPPLLEGGP